jgi:NAD(P)-dependent dehydrogenase (short-subunit alcohol dehydrogenase family)
MTYLVFGGHSPIAISISNTLSKNSKVVHVSRKIDSELTTAFSDTPAIDLAEWNLLDQEACLIEFDKMLSERSIEGIIFAHRYRSFLEHPLERFIVEVETPHQILKSLCAHSDSLSKSIVFLTSPAANQIVHDQTFGYHASKAAIGQLVRYGAIHYTAGLHRVNGVSPGAFIYKKRAQAFYAMNPGRVEQIQKFVPLQRLGSTEDVANVVAFLCSDSASYINGEIINVDGGYGGKESTFALSD